MVARNLHATRAKKRDADPREFLSNFAARHERVLFSTVLPFTSKPPTCSSNWSASKNMPAQLLWIVFPAMEPPLVVADVDAPRAARDVVANDLGVVVGPFRPEDEMPVSPERLMSLERILVPVESRITVPMVLSVMSLERILVPVGLPTTTPTHFPEIIPRDSGIDASFSSTIDREGPSGMLPDIILHDRGVARIACNNDPFGVGIRVAYNIILRDSGVDVLASDDPAGDIAYETVSHNSSVAGTEKVDREQSLLPLLLEAPEREASNAHALHALC